MIFLIMHLEQHSVLFSILKVLQLYYGALEKVAFSCAVLSSSLCFTKFLVHKHNHKLLITLITFNLFFNSEYSH